MMTICITIHASPKEQEHFTKRGVEPEVFRGLNGVRLGLHPPRTFEQTRTGYPVAASAGCWLSHRALWAACLLLPDDEFLILEEDANFQRNWRKRFDTARAQLPSDWDVMFAGSCHADGKASKHIAGDLFEFKQAVPAGHNGLLGGFAPCAAYGYPLCCHAVLIRRKALMPLIEAMDSRELSRSIDISLDTYGLENLRVFGVLPRIVDQWGHVLPA